MSTYFDHGTPDEFEVTWRSGHIDRFVAHQVTQIGGTLSNPEISPRIRFYAEIDGKWRLILDVLVNDLLSVRNVTQIKDIFIQPRPEQ